MRELFDIFYSHLTVLLSYRYGLMLCLLKMYHPLHTLQYTFVGRQTEFTCTTATNESLSNTCQEDTVILCSSLQYEEDTIIAEWDLVCDQNWYSKMTMSSLMLGQAGQSVGEL